MASSPAPALYASAVTTPYRPRPTSGELRELAAAELGLILLPTLPDPFSFNNLAQTARTAHEGNSEPDVEFLLERLSDAWSWLVANGLIGPSRSTIGPEWYRVTARGQEVIAEGTTTRLLADQRLPDDLHEKLRDARRYFRNGDAETAVFEAMKQVEVRLRELSKAPAAEIGAQLARKALNPQGGPLADQNLDQGEKQALSDLFAGALGAFKNPTSHRVVDFEEPARAADAILLAELLMLILDDAEKRLKPSP